MICTTGKVTANEIREILSALRSQGSGVNITKYNNEIINLIREHKLSEEHELDSDCEIEEIENLLYEMRNYTAADYNNMDREIFVKANETKEYKDLTAKLAVAEKALSELQHQGFFKSFFTSQKTRDKEIKAKEAEILSLQHELMLEEISIANKNKNKFNGTNMGPLAITPDAIEYLLSR